MLATFTVTNLNDAPVAMAGDAPGTLRQAIFDANADAVADVIEFQAGLSGTITLTAGQLVISKALSINGPGATLLTIDASGNDPTPTSTLNDGNGTNDGDGSRVFDITDGVLNALINVTVSGVTLTGGDSTDGGAIRSFENLTVADAVLTENVATGSGGGIHAVRQISSIPMLSIQRTTISHNSSGVHGGAIRINNPISVEIAESTIDSNFTFGDGGAIYHTGGAPMIVIQSTISGNSSRGNGGGIFNISGPGSDITIRHSVVTKNMSDADSNGGGFGGGLAINAADLILNHTIVAANIDNTGTGADWYFGGGGLQQMQFTLVGNANNHPEAPVGMPDANGNLVGGPINGVIDPLLDELADNGGPTMTHALLVGSPAIDMGDPAAVAGSGGVPGFDQRGTPFGRVVDGDGTSGARIDMGAFEFVPSSEPALPGDYNANDIVDAADYVVWRKYLNTATALPNDATPGVDDGDYGVWRMHFGDSLPAGSGAGGLATSADPPITMAGQPIDRHFSTAAVDVAMADLATKRDVSVRGGIYFIPRATEFDGVVRSRQLLLVDSVCDRVMSAIAGNCVAEGNRADEPTADGTSKAFIVANEALFAELQCGPPLHD